MFKLLLHKTKTLLPVMFIFMTLPASANWYECRTEKNDSKFSFEASSSRELHIYSPLIIDSLNRTFEGVFTMKAQGQEKFLTDVSEYFDYPCNYQGAELQVLLFSQSAHISIEIKCDGATPFKIYTEKANCTVY